MIEVLHIKDNIYGSFDVADPLLISLIHSPTVQRVKRINQFGIPNEFYHRKNFSRYDHCVGVMLLLGHFGAPEEEQVAGLLHDVSHMAFSHLYDWVVEDHTQAGPKKESAQDARHYDFIQRSEIPPILATHGLNVDRITDYHHFGLLERDIPSLCADRVDYSLRELPTDRAVRIFQGLTVIDGQIICRDLETAALFGRAFLELQREHWGGFEAVARYTYFSAALNRALELGVLSETDFKVDDEFIIAKLKGTPDDLIQQTLQVLRRPLTSHNNGDVFYKKFRHIDPPFMTGDGFALLTEVDEEFRELLESARRENEQGVLVENLTTYPTTPKGS